MADLNAGDPVVGTHGKRVHIFKEWSPSGYFVRLLCGVRLDATAQQATSQPNCPNCIKENNRG